MLGSLLSTNTINYLIPLWANRTFDLVKTAKKANSSEPDPQPCDISVPETSSEQHATPHQHAGYVQHNDSSFISLMETSVHKQFKVFLSEQSSFKSCRNPQRKLPLRVSLNLPLPLCFNLTKANLSKCDGCDSQCTELDTRDSKQLKKLLHCRCNSLDQRPRGGLYGINCQPWL